MIIIGDIHGCYDTMIALIAKVKEKYPDEQIALVGDLVDRGPKSNQVVQYVIDNNIPCVMGNHEDMMVTAYKLYPGSGNDYQWLRNGGDNTQKSYLLPDGSYDLETIQKHTEWMEKLPLYIEFPQVKKDGRHLVISHSNIGKVWDWSQEKREMMHDRFKEIVMWERGYFEDAEGIYNVVGHTPQAEPRIRSFYANIDTGACFYREWVRITGQPKPAYGILTALHYPSMEIFQQENIDHKVPDESQN